MTFTKRYGAILIIFLFIMGLRWLMQSNVDSYKESYDSEKDNDYMRHNPVGGQDGWVPNVDYGEKADDARDKQQPVMESSKRLKGLTTQNMSFFLDDMPMRILSGEIHYFRFPYQYWKDRLLALKACGLNTVTTYIPWNSHEPIKGTFDFTGMLDLPKFIGTAQDVGIYVILRIGPYICAEWEYGGLPSWLLKKEDAKIRTSDKVYMSHVKDWFNRLLPVIKPYQYKLGGPVIAVQVENEYASFPDRDQLYVRQLKDMVQERGIDEFLFACDDRNGILGKDSRLDYAGMMKSINLQHNPGAILKELRKAQPNRPMFVSEYWTGWFNWWGGPNHILGVPWLNTLDLPKFKLNTKELLDTGASLNLYVFAGGTNFGFMNGGMIEEKFRNAGDQTSPDTTSYDYDALVSEEGRLTEKYFIMRSLLQDLNPTKILPEPPLQPVLAAYGSIRISDYIILGKLLVAFKSWMVKSKNPIPMERFPMSAERKDGQSYGYALYETALTGKYEFKLDFMNNVRDRALVFLDTVYQETIVPPVNSLVMSSKSDTKHTVSLLVENQGRVNWVSRQQPGIMENQRKGILGDIKCNDKIMEDWKIWPLEFNPQFMRKLNQAELEETLIWRKKEASSSISTPALMRASLDVGRTQPKDTFVELEGFEKGVLLVNGVNVGRYWNSAGPQKRLYVPGVWLRPGLNDILIFEERKIGEVLSFHNSNGMG